MNKKVSAWENLTPEDLIEKMFERTDADGVLYMPSFFTEEHGDRASLRCVMSWELPGDCFSVLQEFDQLRSAIEQIAERCNRDGNMGEGGYHNRSIENRIKSKTIHLHHAPFIVRKEADRRGSPEKAAPARKSSLRPLSEDHSS